jgi:Platelet-activating factor acetylhydrolase, isoform II
MMISFFLVLAVGLFLLPYWLIRGNPFPQPSGQWQVGVTDFIWDAPDFTGIIAKAWYPTTDKQGINSPYIDKIDRTLAVMTAGMNPVFKSIAKLYFGRIVTPSFVDATPMQLAGGCPVVLFSPGFQSMNFLNTFYALEFASHGFIVIGINHPGISAGSLLADGSQVAFKPVDMELAFAEYEQPDSLFSDLILKQADNISSVLDKIISLNATAGSLLYQKINPNKIFAAGHSTGGAASFVACGKDERIAKGVNLDGIFIDPANTNYANKELFLISANWVKYSPKDKNTRTRIETIVAKDKIQREQLAAKANLHQLSFPSASHFNFMDLPLIIRSLIGKKIGLFGNINGLEVLLKTSAEMIDLFDN